MFGPFRISTRLTRTLLGACYDWQRFRRKPEQEGICEYKQDAKLQGSPFCILLLGVECQSFDQRPLNEKHGAHGTARHGKDTDILGVPNIFNIYYGAPLGT